MTTTDVAALSADNDPALCEACGENPASVFTSEHALCKPCRRYQREHPPVAETAAQYARTLGGAGSRRFKAVDAPVGVEGLNRIDNAERVAHPNFDEEALADWLDTIFDSFADDVDLNESEAVR